MGQDVTNQTRFCQLPQFEGKRLNRHLKPKTIMVVGLSFILTTSLMCYMMVPAPQPRFTPLPAITPPPTPPHLTSHSPIEIDGDVNFWEIAQLEGWPGDGSPENPFIINGLSIFNDGGHLISISNTRVSFTISNCNLTGGCYNSLYDGTGIYLENVTNGEIVNNICNKNSPGIVLYGSSSNTVVNNTCTDNIFGGINLEHSDSNIVANNTCSNWGGICLFDSDYNIARYNTLYNTLTGLRIHGSDFNTLANNNCSNNGNDGIYLDSSDSNTVTNNTCDNNGNHGITLEYSDSNTVANNTCRYNDVNVEDCGDGIYLYDSDSNIVVTNICKYNRNGIYLGSGCGCTNIVADNTCMNNEEFDIVWAVGTVEFGPMGLLFAGIIMLGATWRMLLGIGNTINRDRRIIE